MCSGDFSRPPPHISRKARAPPQAVPAVRMRGAAGLLDGVEFYGVRVERKRSGPRRPSLRAARQAGCPGSKPGASKQRRQTSDNDDQPVRGPTSVRHGQRVPERSPLPPAAGRRDANDREARGV